MEKQTTFNIVATKEAFDTLSSRLYSNPILAVIRELSSNAQDAQNDNGYTEPFEVHIPTTEEPYFRVRDFGKGLSEEFVKEIYTTFFMSTKTYNEKQIGAFGLGSKSPFAIVDEFYVTSFESAGNISKKTTYLMKKEGGIPTVQKISTEDSVEHSGLEIKFNLSDFDDYDWRNIAEDFFKKSSFFPKINLFIDNNFLIERAFYTNNSIRFGSGRTVVTVNVAGVSFPVKASKINTKIFDDARISEINLMVEKNDVDITPSRESLHYDEKTINFLNSKIKEIIDKKFADARNGLISFDEIDNLTKQIYDKDLSISLAQKKSELFCMAIYRASYSKKISATYNCFGLNSCCGKYKILDFSGVQNKTKLRTIQGVLDGSLYNDGKITSTSFNSVAFNFVGSDDVVFIPRKDKFNEAKEYLQKLLGTVPLTVVHYADYIDENPKKRKLGFKTQNMVCFKGASSYLWSGDDPDLKDDEVGLLNPKKEIDLKVFGLDEFLKKIFGDKSVFIKECSDISYERYSKKGFVSLKKVFETFLNKNEAAVHHLFERVRAYEFFRSVFSIYSFNEEIFNLVNDSKYSSLCDKSEIFKFIKKNYNKEILEDGSPANWERWVIGESQLIDFDVAYGDKVEANRKDLINRDTEKFPMLKLTSLRYVLDDAESAKIFFDYLLNN